MSSDSSRGPTRAIQGRPPVDPEHAREWFRAMFGEIPLPTPDMDAKSEDSLAARRRDAVAEFERSVPAAYRWAKFGAPELEARTGGAASWALGESIWREPKVLLYGAASAGKTSLAVACVRRWVAEYARPAGFFHAYALGVARIQHPAGHGEPEMSGSAVPDVMFTRHAEDRPLWVTTGLTRDQLVVRYGTGIVRRLFERAKVINLGGTSP